jgi:iron complex transport system ATP-binding protein
MRLRETMRGLAQSGLGILLVTHHVSEIIPEIERVVLLRDGKIVADGSKEKMLTATHLTDLFNVKVQIAQHDGYYHLY